MKRKTEAQKAAKLRKQERQILRAALAHPEQRVYGAWSMLHELLVKGLVEKIGGNASLLWILTPQGAETAKALQPEKKPARFVSTFKCPRCGTMIAREQSFATYEEGEKDCDLLEQEHQAECKQKEMA